MGSVVDAVGFGTAVLAGQGEVVFGEGSFAVQEGSERVVVVGFGFVRSRSVGKGAPVPPSLERCPPTPLRTIGVDGTFPTSVSILDRF